MEKKVGWGQDAMIWRQPKIMAPILGKLHKAGIDKQAHARTTTDNKKDNIKVCVCSFSSHGILFVSV